MFKKPVGVAGAIYIKGIGCGGMVGAECFEYQARSPRGQQAHLRRHLLLKGSGFGGRKPRSRGRVERSQNLGAPRHHLAEQESTREALGLEFFLDAAVTSYPDHKTIFAGESNKRSLRRPPQLGQVMGRVGLGAALGKATSKPQVVSIRELM